MKKLKGERKLKIHMFLVTKGREIQAFEVEKGNDLVIP